MEQIITELVTKVVAFVISLLISLTVTIVLYVVVLPDSKRGEMGKIGNFVHDFLKMKKLYIEKVIRFFYVFFTVSGIISGIGTLKDSIGLGILTIILSPIITRLLFELIMLKVIEVKNIVELNNNLCRKKDGPEFDTSLGNRFAEKTNAMISAAINAAKESSVDNEELSSNSDGITCPNCGMVVIDGDFCPNCGTKL